MENHGIVIGQSTSFHRTISMSPAVSLPEASRGPHYGYHLSYPLPSGIYPKKTGFFAGQKAIPKNIKVQLNSLESWQLQFLKIPTHTFDDLEFFEQKSNPKNPWDP